MCASDRNKGLMSSLVPTLLLGIAVLAAPLPSQAQSSPEGRDQEQIKRLRLQLRQVQQDQATAQEGQAKADQARQQSEKSLTESQSELKRLRASSAARASALGKEAEALKEERARLQAQVQALNTQMAELKGQAQAAQVRAQASEADLKGRNQALGDHIAQCGRHNAELAGIGEDLLARYENKGFGQVLGERDPFIQTSRVRLENLLAQYQDRIDAARVKPAASSAAQP